MAKSKPELVRAVAYTRKSTKGTGADGRERQEKSLGQQRAEMLKLANDRYEIAEWFEDDGVSGWKRGGKRPGFERMLNGVQELGAEAVLCDNIDRFSRAAFDETQEDASKLRKAGCRFIVTASHGTYDLGARYDIGSILQFVVAVWAANEYSRQLSRRVSLARRNQVLDGKRPGAPAPYGYRSEGNGGLVPGDKKEVATVRWIFEQFASQRRSMCWIAKDLNARGVPSPKGKQWHEVTVRGILRRSLYSGQLTYNEVPRGQFFCVDGEGEVVPVEDAEGRKVFRLEKAWKPLVTDAVWRAAQKRLEAVRTKQTARKNQGYPLSGILVCDHCGAPMYGLEMAQKYTYYRCANAASGSCGNWMVRQDRILPWVMQLLGAEIKSVRELLSAPPTELVKPRKQDLERREAAEQRVAELRRQVAAGEENLLFVNDARTRRSLDERLTALRDEMERLETELAGEPVAVGYTAKELLALNEWWDRFMAEAVSVPVKGELPPHAVFWQDRESEEQRVMISPRVVNGMLRELGAEVRLRWETETKPSGQRRYRLVRGRFRLGQREGKLPKYLLERTVGRTFQEVKALLGRVDRVFDGAKIAS